MEFLGGLTAIYMVVAARYFWITRPPVMYDEQYRRWRAARGTHRQYGREHRHAGLIRSSSTPVAR